MGGPPTQNKLLDGIPAQELERLRPHLEEVPLVQKRAINAPAKIRPKTAPPAMAKMSQPI